MTTDAAAQVGLAIFYWQNHDFEKALEEIPRILESNPP